MVEYVGERQDTAGGAGHQDACALALCAFRGTLVLTALLKEAAAGGRPWRTNVTSARARGRLYLKRCNTTPVVRRALSNLDLGRTI